MQETEFSKRMEGRVGRLEAAVNTLEKAVIEMNGNINGVKHAVESLKHFLQGNGQPGALTKMQNQIFAHDKMIWMLFGGGFVLNFIIVNLPPIIAVLYK